MPKSVRCQFDRGGWAPCKKPSDNGWCSEHEGLKCVSCGKQATHSCDAQMGGLGCGAPLCGDCSHAYSGKRGHVANVVLRRESAAQEASRLSPSSRMNQKLGVPATLFELFKGDWQKDYVLKRAYYAELSHGLMGFFPAVFSLDDRRMVVTTDLRLMERVWQLLEPRDAKLREAVAYINESTAIAYLYADSTLERENRKPFKVLTVSEFESLAVAKEQPFKWAFGLIGCRRLEESEHIRSFATQAQSFDPSFGAHA